MTGVQTCALPICLPQTRILELLDWPGEPRTVKLLRKWWLLGRSKHDLNKLRENLGYESRWPPLRQIADVVGRHPECAMHVRLLLADGAHPLVVVRVLAQGDAVLRHGHVPAGRRRDWRTAFPVMTR